MKTVLITGATGSVGSRLTKEYLDCGQYKVFVIVRAASQRHAEERMKDILGFWDVNPQLHNRLEVLQGDVCEPMAGLSDESLGKVRSEVNLVVHAAANIRLDLSLAEARHQIVSGTQNVVQVARSCGSLECFGFVSTMEVMGDYSGIAYEEFLTDYKRNFLNSYEVAKFEAEEYLKSEIAQGFPAAVFRLGMVVGESQSGKVLGFQSFYLLLERMLLEPLSPVLPWGCPVDVIPVDILARAVVALMEYPGTQGEVFHLSAGMHDRASFKEFLDKVQPILECELGRPIKRPIYISPIFYHAVLKLLNWSAWGRMKRHVKVQLVFIRFMSLEWQFDNSRTKAVLESLDVMLPSFDKVLPNLVRYYLSHRSEKRFPL